MKRESILAISDIKTLIVLLIVFFLTRKLRICEGEVNKISLVERLDYIIVHRSEIRVLLGEIIIKVTDVSFRPLH